MPTSTATVLFTDVEGSTELRSRVGEAAADALFVDHERRLAAAVQRRSGRVLKTAGDGIMAAFDSASDAVVAAIEMQRAVERRDDGIHIRIGIASGDVSWEGDDCFGLPVVTAARLETAAAGRQILVSQVVRWLAGERSGATFENGGALELKGLPGPVETFSVVWELQDEAEPDAFPLPGQLARHPAFTFVGRQAESDALAAAWSAVEADNGRRLVLVGGEAGAGKTRLAAEFARAAHRAGASVLFGGCDPELLIPYQPWVQVLDALLRHVGDDLDLDVAADLLPLAPLLPTLGQRPSNPPIVVDPEVERYRLFSAIDAVFVEASRRQPLILIIDDLHWASAQTLALLAHLARCGGARMLIIATFRDTGEVSSAPLTSTLADLRRIDGVSRIGLRGLATDDVVSLVAGVVGHELDGPLSSLAAEISTRTLGNAFFVGEMWRHMVASGVVTQHGARWVARGSLAESGVPDSIREVVSERLARLPFPVRRLVDLIAAAGQRVELRTLRVASDMTGGELATGLDQLVESGLLEAVQRPLLAYQFTHALVRDTVEAGVPLATRARLHLRVGEALEAMHEADPRPVLADLARHYAAAAGLGSDAKAVYYGRRAGEQAFASLAFDEATEYLTTALELAGPSEARVSILTTLGDVLGRVGRFDEARGLLEEAFHMARERGWAALAAPAAMSYSDTERLPGVPAGASIAVLSEAIALLGDDGSSIRVQLEGALAECLALSGRMDEAREAYQRTRKLAATSDDLAKLWAASAGILVETDPARVLECAVEVEQVVARTGATWYMISGGAGQMRALTALGRLDEAEAVLVHHRAQFTRSGMLIPDLETCCFEATLALARGRFDDAERAAEAALHVGTDRHPGAAGVYGLQMFAIRREQGRLAEVASVLEMAAKRGSVDVWRPGLAVLFTELGRLDEARALFDVLAEDDFASIARDSLWPATSSFLADVCIALRDAARAEVLYPCLREFAGQNLMVAFTICLGPAERLLGGLAAVGGRLTDAERHFEAAAHLCEEGGAPPWLARVQHDWAAVRIAAGDPRGAAPLVTAALETATQLGMTALAERCRLLNVPLAEAAFPDGLSAREVDVVRLIAAGCSNREIGERLFISGNTAANHVRAILQKTGCANRAEAAAYAARHALV